MKKAIKISLIVVAACVVIFLAIGFISLAVHPEEPTSSAAVQVGDDFLSLARQAVEGRNYDGGVVTDVIMDGRDLRISIDMSNSIWINLGSNEAGLDDVLHGLSDAAAEKVLALGEQYDDLWDTITVDFGDLGYIVNHVEDVQILDNDETGVHGRYFPSWSYEIQH